MLPSTILHNARITTSAPSDPAPTAIGVRADRIAAVGTDAELLDWDSQATRIDLEGRLVLPGFIDSHIHLLGYGLSLQRIDLKGVGSLRECLRIIQEGASALPPGAWVQGRGWNYNSWIEGRFPTRQDLDSVCPDRPAAFSSVDGHALWVNSLAMEMAGVNRNTPDPEGGRIDRDPETGEPTGILAERANGLVRSKIPQPSAEERRLAVQQAIVKANRAGLTGVHDCNGDDIRRELEALRASGELSLRFWMMIPAGSIDRAIDEGRKTGQGDALLRTGAIKAFADGALGPQTAAMLEPYEGNDNMGVTVMDRDGLTDIVRRAHANGLEVATHAIGDRSIRDVLDAVQAAATDVGGRHRPRIEHAQVVHPDDLERFGQLGVIASMQPIHATADMHIADRHWGSRARLSYAWRTLRRAGARLAFGSDCPVEPLSVLAGIHAAVTRQLSDGEPPGGWYPEERLSVHEAIEAYTLGAAYAAGEEADKGSIECDKLADLVVLSKDITSVPPEEILDTEPVLTLVGGDIVFDGR